MSKLLPCILLMLITSRLGAEALSWETISALPDKEGFAGSFAGVCNGVLLVAGGTNFPDKRPWEGGTKMWYEAIFALTTPTGTWQRVGSLPRGNGYGVSITTPEGLVCIGGGNTKENFRSVFRLRHGDGKVTVEPLPSLPKACAFMAGTLLGSRIFIAGGIETPTATTASSAFWSLDLNQLQRGWQTLPSWPGPERILACMGSAEGSVLLFSGARLKAGPDGKPVREWLRDGYRFSLGQGWTKIADMPRSAVAAPSPAPLRDGRLLILGGDDGELSNLQLEDKHPGFPRGVLSYDVPHNRWSVVAELPFSLVTTPAVIWQNRIVIPGGEARPGKRSPEVWRER